MSMRSSALVAMTSSRRSCLVARRRQRMAQAAKDGAAIMEMKTDVQREIGGGDGYYTEG